MTDKVYHFAGIDLHKSNSYITILDQDGNKVFQDKIQNDKLAIQRALLQSNIPTRAVVESTFNSYWLVDTLREVGINTIVIDPRKTKAIGISRIKTDKIDSRTIAELNRINFLSMVYIPSISERELRDITRQRIDLVEQRTILKNKIINILHRNCIYKLPYRDMFGKGGRKWLLGDNLEIADYQKNFIKRNLTIIDSFDEQINEFNQELKKYAQTYPSVALLKTMPGISDLSALSLLAEIGNIHRFPNSKTLSSYAGMSPSTYSSNTTTVHGSITKQGSSYIRRCLGFSVKHLIQKNAYLNHFYHRKVEAKGIKKAKTACMRKTLTYIYQMLKENKEYLDLIIAKRQVDSNPRRQA
jgi:transposase